MLKHADLRRVQFLVDWALPGTQLVHDHRE
jgi:hypothetical protein